MVRQTMSWTALVVSLKEAVHVRYPTILLYPPTQKKEQRASVQSHYVKEFETALSYLNTTMWKIITSARSVFLLKIDLKIMCLNDDLKEL